MDTGTTAIAEPSAAETQNSPEPESGSASTPTSPPTPPADLGREPDPQPDDEDAQPGLFLVGPYAVDKKPKARKPDGAKLKIKMVKADLGQSAYGRGDVICVTSLVQVTGDHEDDSIETQTGAVHSTSREQKATTLTIAGTEEWLASKIEDDDLLARVCIECDLDLPARLRDAA